MQLTFVSGLLCLILLLLPIHSYAEADSQGSEIQGKIISTTTGKPIPNAHILTEKSSVGTTSDSNGSFTILIPEIMDDEALIITHVNFSSKRVLVSPSMFDGTQIFNLNPKQHSLRPITVVSHRTLNQPVDRLQTNESVFKPIDSGAFLLNAPNVSGVRRGGFGLDPVVRGFANSRLNIRVDGLTSTATACPNRMDPPTSHIRISDIERVEIHHGPHALQFGPSFGGTVNFVKHKKPEVESLTFSGDVRGGFESNTGHRLSDARILVANPIFDLLFSGGLSYAGDYTSGNGIGVNAGFQSYDYGLDFGLNIAENHRLNAGWTQSFVRDADFPSLSMDMAVDDTYKITLGYVFTPVNNSYIRELRLNGYHNMVDHEMNNFNRPSLSMRTAQALAETRSSGMQAHINGFSSTGTWALISSFDQVDVKGNRFVTFNMGPNAGNSIIYKLWQDSRITNAGLFVGTEQFSGTWMFSGGIRIDYNKADATDLAPRFQNRDLSSEHLNLSISGGVSQAISNDTRVSFYLGRGVRSPDVTERFINFLAVGRNAFEFAGNPNLKSEANNQADLIFETRVNDIQFRMNLFAAYTTNYISAVINPDLNPVGINAPGVREFRNVGDAVFTGFEISGSTPVFNNWNLQADVSYTFAEYTNSGEPVAEIAPLETALSLKGVLFDKLSPRLSIRRVSAQNRYDQAFGESRTSGFWLANIELGYVIGFGLHLNAGVRNLFDEVYMEHLNRNFNPEISSEGEKLMEPGRRVFAELTYRF